MSSNDWQEWIVETYSQLVEPLEEWLFAQGALAVSLEDNADEPLLEPRPGETPLWQNIKVTALFSGSLDLVPIKQALPSSLLAGNSRNEISTLQDRDWERVWMEDFTPIQMGPRLWICPSWTPPPDPGATNILLDPGLAFGTGSHPTTAMCLRALDAGVTSGIRLVDYGCGSGILGIAGARLGAGSVLGVDNDPQAILASGANASGNEVTPSQFSAVLPDDALIEQWAGTTDWVIANILAGPLVALKPVLTQLLTPGGQLTLAGLLEKQAKEVIEAYAPDVALAVVDQREEWVLLSGRAV